MIKDIRSWIDSEIEHIDSVLNQFKAGRTKKRSGSVYRLSTKNHTYYVKRKRLNGVEKKIYLGSSDSSKTKAAKEEQLDSALYDALSNDRKLLKMICDKYEPYDLSALECHVSPCLHNVQCDYVIDKRMEPLFAWAAEDYPKNTMPFPKQVILTKDGTRVRSKDEAIIYDALKDMNMPFRNDWLMEFESPWDYGDMIMKAPDFVIPSFNGDLTLVEHAGLLMKQHYAEEFVQKLQIYLYNGYVLGDNLFISSDDYNNGVNIKAIIFMLEGIYDRLYRQ